MIELARVTKSFGGRRVLDGLSFSLRDPGVTVLMGPNGSGKTTAMKLILGLLHPDSGRIEGTAGRSLSAVFQEDRLVEHVTAVANVRLVLEPRVANGTIEAELTRAGLAPQELDRAASTLSGGQRRRVAVVRAMMADADVVCLDEPFEGLDAGSKESLMRYVRERTLGKSVLLITHDASEAAWFGGTSVRLGGEEGKG